MTAAVAAPAVLPDSPFRGLVAYGEGDFELFFGRAREAQLIAANLLAARLTIVYGPSGVGKSSLVRAGVIHRLRTDEELQAPDEDVPAPVIVFVDDWTGDPAADVRRAIDAAVASVDGEVELLLILDQFEDYLLAYARGGELDDFLAQLLSVRSRDVRLLVSLREDALAAMDRFKGRMPGVFDTSVRLAGLDRAAALEAVERPVQRYAELTGRAAELQPGLAEAVVDGLADAGGEVEPVHLQLVMQRLWDAGSGRLDLATLATLGGPWAIVRDHFRHALATLSPRERELTADVMRYLVTPSGAWARSTPRDLASYTGHDEQEIMTLLELLSGSGRRVLRAVPSPPGSSSPVAYELFHHSLAEPALAWWSALQTRRLERRSARLLAALLAVSAVAVGLALYVWLPAPLRKLELSTVDARFAIRGAQAPDSRLVLVGIDRATVAAGYDRAMLARTIDTIAQAGPRVIALDLIAEAPHTSPAADLQLKAAIRRNGSRLVVATAKIDTSTGTGLAADFMGSPGFLERAGAHPGYAGLPADDDGVARRVEYQLPAGPTLQYPTFAFVTAHRVDPRVIAYNLPKASRWARADQSAGNAWIDFAGGRGAYSYVPLADVARGRVAPGLLTGQIVVVGFAIPPDVHKTATAHSPPMNGMELQANAISTLLRQAPLRDASAPASVLAILLLGLLPLAVWLLGGPLWRSALLLAAAVAVFLVVAQLRFDGGRILSVVTPLLALVLALAGIAVAEGRRRRRHAA